MPWNTYIAMVGECLQNLTVIDSQGRSLDPLSGFAMLCEMTARAKRRKKTVFLLGNGASASMASHVAADLAKNGGVRTEVFTDVSLLTAIGNDISFDEIFSEPLRRKMIQGDLLVAISSSGMSPNVVLASTAARQLGGGVVTVSAMSPDNHLRRLGDLNFHVPAETYSLAESCHAALLHFWIDQMVAQEQPVALARVRNV